MNRIAEEARKSGYRGKRISKGDLKKARERFFLHLRSKKRKGRDVRGLKAGDWVRVVSLTRVGLVNKVYGDSKRADVQVGNLKVSVPFRDLERTAPQPMPYSMKDEGITYEVPPEKAVPSEINIVGLTVEEALPVLDKFIDDAIVGKLEKVDIIHGLGTGRLREAVGEHLRHHRSVKRFGPKDLMRSGVTIVEFW